MGGQTELVSIVAAVIAAIAAIVAAKMTASAKRSGDQVDSRDRQIQTITESYDRLVRTLQDQVKALQYEAVEMRARIFLLESRLGLSGPVDRGKPPG